MATKIGDYQKIRYKIGRAASVEVQATEIVFGVYDRYKITEINGGEMYDDINQFTAEYYDPIQHMWIADSDTKWRDFIGSTLNFNMEPVIQQDIVPIDLHNCNKVAAHFLDGLWCKTVYLDNIGEVGDYGLAGGYETVQVGNLPHRTTNPISGVVIDNNAILGRGALAYCNVLTNIRFGNTFVMPDTLGGNNPLYVEKPPTSEWGTEAYDNNGNLYTRIQCYNNQAIINYDWEGHCNRHPIFERYTVGYLSVYNEQNDRIIRCEGPNIRREDLSKYDITIWGKEEDAFAFDLVDPSRTGHASDIRVCSNGSIMAIEKYTDKKE